MALPATTVLEVRTGASDNNGGGFVTGETGTDYSQQDAAQASLTIASLVHSTTTQINVAVGDFTVSALDVGNLLQITGGAATAGVYRITAADVANNRWTLDRSAGTVNFTVVGSMGGAFATPGKASAIGVVAGIITWVRAGNYNITSTTSNVSGGRVTLGTANTRMIGYQSTRGDLTGVRPLLTATVNTMTMVTSTNDVVFGNINLSAGSATGIGGTSSSAGSLIHDVKVTGANASTTGAFLGGANSCHLRCEASGGSTNGFHGQGGHFIGCVASGIAGRGFQVSGSQCSVFSHCLAINNTGGSGKGFDLGTATGSAIFLNCTAYGNASENFDNSSAPVAACNWINCLAVGSTTAFGFTRNGRAWNCAAFNNNDGNYGSSVIKVGSFDLAADPFVDATGLDFALNDEANGGGVCRAAGFLGAFPPLVVTTSYMDIGCAQHQDGTSPGPVNSVHVLLALPRGWDVES